MPTAGTKGKKMAACPVALGADVGGASSGLVGGTKVVATGSGPTAEAGVPSLREDSVAWAVAGWPPSDARVGGPYKAPSSALTSSRRHVASCGQYRSIRREGGSTPPGGFPPDKA